VLLLLLYPLRRLERRTGEPLVLVSTLRRRRRSLLERLLCLPLRPERRLPRLGERLRLLRLGERLLSFLLRSFSDGDREVLRSLRRRRGEALLRLSFRLGERDLRFGERDRSRDPRLLARSFRSSLELPFRRLSLGLSRGDRFRSIY